MWGICLTLLIHPPSARWGGPPGPGVPSGDDASSACWQAGQGAGRGRGPPPHIAPQNAGYLSQAATPLAVNVASNQFHEVSQCTQEGERPFGVAAAFVNQSGQM